MCAIVRCHEKKKEKKKKVARFLITQMDADQHEN